MVQRNAAAPEIRQAANQIIPGDRLLSRAQVLEKLHLRNSSLYAKIKEGVLPPPIKVSPSRSAWLESEINSYIADRVAERDADRANEEART